MTRKELQEQIGSHAMDLFAKYLREHADYLHKDQLLDDEAAAKNPEFHGETYRNFSAGKKQAYLALKRWADHLGN